MAVGARCSTACGASSIHLRIAAARPGSHRSSWQSMQTCEARARSTPKFVLVRQLVRSARGISSSASLSAYRMTMSAVPESGLPSMTMTSMSSAASAASESSVAPIQRSPQWAGITTVRKGGECIGELCQWFEKHGRNGRTVPGYFTRLLPRGWTYPRLRSQSFAVAPERHRLVLRIRIDAEVERDARAACCEVPLHQRPHGDRLAAACGRDTGPFRSFGDGPGLGGDLRAR